MGLRTLRFPCSFSAQHYCPWHPLANRVLHARMHMPRALRYGDLPPQVTRSDWAAPSLSLRQVLHAAQDALVCGGIFRELVLQDGGGGGGPYADYY